MHLQVSGPGIPAELVDVVASMTDHARLRYGKVTHDPKSGVVRLPIARVPLVKKHKVLPDARDHQHPIAAVVTVRNVVACNIENNTPPDLGEEVQLLFGIQLQAKRVYACSAEETRGQTCFSVTLEVFELDVEIADVADATTEDGA